jgi:hypothetical protein
MANGLLRLTAGDLERSVSVAPRSAPESLGNIGDDGLRGVAQLLDV